MTTITRINENTLSVIIHDGATPTIVERNGDFSQLISFNTKEVQQHFWNMLMGMATGSIDPSAPMGPKTAELEMLSERIDALENNDQCNDTAQQYCRQLIRNLETRLEVVRDNASEQLEEVKRDIDMHGKQLEDLENADPADIDEAHLHDLVVDLVKSDENGTIRRKVLEVVRDALS